MQRLFHPITLLSPPKYIRENEHDNGKNNPLKMYLLLNMVDFPR